MHVCVSMCACICVYMCICMYVEYMCTCMYVYVFFIYMCVYVYMYVLYMYVYVYTHLCICVYVRGVTIHVFVPNRHGTGTSQWLQRWTAVRKCGVHSVNMANVKAFFCTAEFKT